MDCGHARVKPLPFETTVAWRVLASTTSQGHACSLRLWPAGPFKGGDFALWFAFCGLAVRREYRSACELGVMKHAVLHTISYFMASRHRSVSGNASRLVRWCTCGFACTLCAIQVQQTPDDLFRLRVCHAFISASLIAPSDHCSCHVMDSRVGEFTIPRDLRKRSRRDAARFGQRHGMRDSSHGCELPYFTWH